MASSVVHLTTRSELNLPGSPLALCGVYVSDLSKVTSRIFDGTCTACVADCACSSAPDPCDICADLEG